MAQTLRHIQVSYPEPHLERMRKILTAHPEIRKLFGPTSMTAGFVFGIVALQVALCFAMPGLPWWAIFVLGYTVGAVANHALWVLIHECTHNLVFKTSAANSWLQILANLPIVFPSAISFRIYHIKHHLHQGDFDRDADLPRPFEAAWVGNSTWRKTVWYFFFFLSQLVRVPFLKGIEFFNGWVALNFVAEFAFLGAVTWFLGPKALAYLAVSSVFSIGLHPLGARWIQEHYVVHENQETYSYYGPLNKVAFNVGYHNEHHDLMSVPWVRLPQVRAMAPEFYDTLYWHRSWTGLLIRFLTDPKLSLYSRVIRIRAPRKAEVSAGMTQGNLGAQTEEFAVGPSK
jgi:sphingolipid delta-4 desaturase